MLPERPDQTGAATHPLQRAEGVYAQLAQILRAEIGQFVLLEMAPDVFGRIQFGRIGGKELQPKAPALLPHKLPHRPTAMRS